MTDSTMQVLVVCHGPDKGKAVVRVTDYPGGRWRQRDMAELFVNEYAARRHIEEANDPI